MHNSRGPSAQRPATIAFIALLLGTGIAVIAAATAHASVYKMVACAGNNGAPAYQTTSNTTSPQNPGGIFDFNNWCGGQGGDPPGDAAYMRINENQAGGNAGQGAYGQIIVDTPGWVHMMSAGGYTRQPYAFNDGWRARFWIANGGGSAEILSQGAGLPNSGLQSPSSNIFGPHLWPFGNFDGFTRFVYELECVRPAGCDRANYNATDANGFVFILSDDSPSQVSFTHTDTDLMAGKWTRGDPIVYWAPSDLGSGLRNEWVRVDGSPFFANDYGAMGWCDTAFSQTNGEWARSFQPCLTGGPFNRAWNVDTSRYADGAHEISVCTKDFGQYQGLWGTGSETCDRRTIHVDNHAPGAPAGLRLTSANPGRYLDHFSAQFSLPSDPGSPIAKVHYDVTDAAGNAVMAERVISGTNPLEIPDITGPARAGDYRLRVWLEDSVGLSGPAATAAIPHDTTPPAAPQDISVTPPTTSRPAQGFDVRWRNIPDGGSPIAAVHYRVLKGNAEVLVPATTIEGSDPQAIEDLDTPRQSGGFTLQLWLSDAEGNVGAPVSVPLAYGCVRSEAADGTALSAAVSPDGKPSVVVAQGAGAELIGRLTGAGGRGVSNASLCVFSKVVSDPTAEFLGVALTGADGAYRFAVPAGASRELSVTYRAGHREITASAQVATKVKPFLKLRKKVVRNKGVATFEGWIPGPHNDNVVVVLQVKRGDGWLAFHRYRTREDGHFTLGYRFNRTSRPTLYLMRAQVRDQSGYPYLQGTSDPLKLVVLPARGEGR